MNKLDMKNKATQIAREASRSAGLSQTAQAMGYLPDVIEAAQIDAEYLIRRVEAELNRKTGNPINALLRLMGLRIVRTHNAAQTLGLDEEETYTIVYDEEAGCGESLLKINEKKLAQAADKIARSLLDVEEANRRDRQQDKANTGAVFTELDRTSQECAQLRSDLQGQKTAVLERVQYMLSLLGSQDDSPIRSQLTELLEDLDVTVYWEAEGAPFSDSAMFAELKCSNPESRRMKPCLGDDTGVLLKGLRFTARAEE